MRYRPACRGSDSYGGIAMEDHVYRVIEITGSSQNSIEDAIQTAVTRASQTLRNLRRFEAIQTRGQLEGDRFEEWYATEHLPWALRVFEARRAWRCWSHSTPGGDPAVHVAFYEFDSVEAAQATQTAEATKALVADFDRVWAGRVTRRR